MDIFIPIFIFFTIFVLCSLCGFCCKKRNEGAIFTTPVVITSQTHQPVGAPTAYPVHTNHYHTTILPPSMPQPYSDSGASYPTAGAPYPTSGAPYPSAGSNMPYPPTTYGQQPYPPTAGAPYPASAPYGQQQASMDPPAYNEVVAQQNYQKQAPYNPSYTG